MQQVDWKQERLFLGTGLMVILVIELVIKAMGGKLTPNIALELLASTSWKVMALWVVKLVLARRYN